MYLFQERPKSSTTQIFTKTMLDNTQFWKVVKPLFSNKSISGDKTNLTENVKTEMKTADVFNSFLSNIVNNLKIPKYSNFDPIAQNIEGPTFDL